MFSTSGRIRLSCSGVRFTCNGNSPLHPQPGLFGLRAHQNLELRVHVLHEVDQFLGRHLGDLGVQFGLDLAKLAGSVNLLHRKPFHQVVLHRAPRGTVDDFPSLRLVGPGMRRPRPARAARSVALRAASRVQPPGSDRRPPGPGRSAVRPRPTAARRMLQAGSNAKFAADLRCVLRSISLSSC